MASLTTPHWEAAAPGAQEFLDRMRQFNLLQPFYLGGGTALALHLGHRFSLDFDLFANIETFDDELRRGIVEALSKDRTVNLVEDSPLGLVLEVEGQAVSFF